MTGPIGKLSATVILVSLLARPAGAWETATGPQAGLDLSLLERARDYALGGGGSGCILRGSQLVLTWGNQATRYDLKSTTKSIGVTALGLAISDGLMDVPDRARDHYPAIGLPGNEGDPRLAEIRIWQLATHTAGFDKPGGFEKLLFVPGTAWSYSDGGANWLADCLTAAYHQDLRELMFSRVFSPLGITAADLTWRSNAYRTQPIDGVARREFGSGISANVDAMAKIGLLYLRGGRWDRAQIIPESFVDAVGKPWPQIVGLPVRDPVQYPNASDHYGLLWWNNGDGILAGVPTDAYWSWGLYDSLIVVVPSLDLVAARAGSGWRRDWNGDYQFVRPFLEPICQSVARGAPYPSSPVITSLVWAPAASVVRRALGSDNWPITWADDNDLYTVYGDGWGFEPRLPNKLSMGFAKVIGSARDFEGVNIRSADEQYGDGAKGRKGCGLLMVDGVLYLWVRNVNGSQGSELWWSSDHAQTWTKARWTWTEFGYPTFINFGPNYAGAADDYVYTVSHDNPDAYLPADSFVLMRVPKDRITQKDQYEFFRHLDSNGAAVWTSDLQQRGAVFTFPAHCRRSGISYNATLGRYLWWQICDGTNGFGVYDAPHPWGPWTTVYFTENWDMAPGETGSFPTKWMSPDGRTIHLVFSGDDAFSVRQAVLTTARTASSGPELP
jgi:CubicO group peptidase (beta-lactamase class C family)